MPNVEQINKGNTEVLQLRSQRHLQIEEQAPLTSVRFAGDQPSAPKSPAERFQQLSEDLSRFVKADDLKGCQRVLIELAKIEKTFGTPVTQALKDFSREQEGGFDSLRQRQVEFARTAARDGDQGVMKAAEKSFRELAQEKDEPKRRVSAMLDLAIARYTLKFNDQPAMFLLAQGIDLAKELKVSVNSRPINLKNLTDGLEVLSGIQKDNPSAKAILHAIGIQNPNDLQAFKTAIDTPANQKKLLEAINGQLDDLIEINCQTLLQELKPFQEKIDAPPAVPVRGWQPPEAMRLPESLRNELSNLLGIALGRKVNDGRNLPEILRANQEELKRPITKDEYKSAGIAMGVPKATPAEVRQELLKRLGLPGQAADDQIRHALSWNEKVATAVGDKKAADAAILQLLSLSEKAQAAADKTAAEALSNRQGLNGGISNDLAKSAKKLAGEPVEKPAERLPDKPAEKPVDKPAEEFEKFPKLKDNDLKNVQYLQGELITYLPLSTEVKLTDDRKKIEEDIKSRQDKIKLEKDAGIYGPATKEAYKQYLGWLEKTAVPGEIQQSKDLELALQTNSAIVLPKDAQGRGIHPELYRALGTLNELKLDLQINPEKIPTFSELDKLDATRQTLKDSFERREQVLGLAQDWQLRKFIKENNLPPGWLDAKGMEPAVWRKKASEMIDLAIKARNYVDVMESLKKGSQSKDFPLELPLGAKVKLNDETHEVVSVHLDLPKDLCSKNPREHDKIERLREWMEKYHEVLDTTLLAVTKARENPDGVIQWGDIEVHGLQGRFDKSNNFIGLVDPKKFDRSKLAVGDHLEDLNLVENRFRITEKDGKIIVTQSVQAQMVPTYLGYQNMTWDNIGNKMQLAQKVFNPQDFVPINNGGTFEIIRAKDLKQFGDRKAAFHYGEKALIATMDVAMLVEVVVTLGAAIPAVGAEEVALRLTARQLAKELCGGGLKMLMVGAGFMNSAGGRDSELGRAINTARALYFLTDVGVGGIRQVYGLARGAEAAEGVGAALTSGKKIEKALENMHWVYRGSHKGAELAFKAIEVPFAIQIGVDIKEKLHSIQHMSDRDPLSDALEQYGDGRGNQLPESNPRSAEVFKAAQSEIDAYSALLRANSKDPESVKEIMEQTRKLLGPEATDQQRQEFRNKLLSQIAFDEKEIKEIETSLGRWPLFSKKVLDNATTVEELERLYYSGFFEQGESVKTVKQLKEVLSGGLQTYDYLDALRDPIKVQTNDHLVINRCLQQKIAQDHLAKIDPEVQTARIIALLYLSRDKDGRLPKDEIASVTTTVTAKDFTSSSRKLPQHEVTQTLKVEDLIRMLKYDLESSPLSSRSNVACDILMKTGAMSGQEYAAVLQEVLDDQRSTREDKRRALTWMASIIGAVRLKESEEAKLPKNERDLKDVENFGVSSAGLLATLDKVARTDSDPQIRASAAMVSFAAQVESPKRRQEVLSDVAQRLLETEENEKKKFGSFADWAANELQKDFERPVPSAAIGDLNAQRAADLVRADKLNAALHFESLIDAKDQAAQAKINRALAESFSPTDKDLSLRVLKYLLPDRINQLTNERPDLANQARSVAVSLCQTPLPLEPALNKKQSQQLLQLIGNMDALLKQGPQSYKVDLARQLEAAIDSSPGNRKNGRFAQYNPELRVAAINALTELGSSDPRSLNLIRAHLSSAAAIQIGNESLPAGEPDAAVRLAAVRSLARLPDPKLRGLALDLLTDKELDPAVAMALRDLRFTQKRIPRDSRQWKEIEEETERKLIPPKGMPKDFGDKAALDLLASKFPLLDNTRFDQERKEAADNANSWWGSNMPLVFGGTFPGNIEMHRRDAANAKQIERNRQWDDLKKTALQGDEEGNRAMYLLNYIMVKGGSPCASSLDDTRNEGCTNPNTIPVWEEKAAKALADCAIHGAGGRSLAMHFIRNGLTHEGHLSSGSTLALLNGWRELGKNPNEKDCKEFFNGNFRELLARTTAQALDVQIQRTDKQNDKVIVELIQDLRLYQDRTVLPVLEAISLRGARANVRDYAQQVLSDLRDSVDFVWKGTVADQLSTPTDRALAIKPEDRAMAVKAALSEEKDAEQTVQAICSAYKGYNLKDENDPGVPFLRLAMNNTDTMVRIAACRAIIESKLDRNGASVQSAKAVLNQIAKEGAMVRYKQEASTILSGMLSNK